MMILVLGAFLGFIAVAFGAYAEHGLREVVTEEQFRFLMTAVRYNQIHAAVIVAIGLAALTGSRLAGNPTLLWTGAVFIVGTMLFSFSIYISVMLGLPVLLNITPVGGITIMMAWLLLVTTGIIARKEL